MVTIVVTGDRNWTDEDAVYGQLSDFPLGTVLIHGDQGDEDGKRGLDRMAARIGTMLGFVVIPFPADWDKHGKAAGPRRNAEMLDHKDHGPIDVVIGFHDDLPASLGTRDCLREANKCGLPTRLVSHNGNISPVPDDLVVDTRRATITATASTNALSASTKARATKTKKVSIPDS